MKTFRQLCAVFVLTCVLAVSCFAGEMSAGIVPPPSQPTSTPSQAAPPIDETENEVIEFLGSLLQSVLSVF